MRVLVTTTGSPSHGRAQLPLVGALVTAGHQVLVATTPPLASVFAHERVRVVECLADQVPGYHETPRLFEIAARKDLDEAERQRLMGRVLAGALTGTSAREMHAALRPVVEDFRPDLILRDGMDMSSVLTSEQLSVPQLPTPSGASNVLDPVDLLPGLNELRAENGLPVQDDPLSLVPYGRVDYVPAGYSFARHLPTSLAYRQTLTVGRGLALPPWVVDLPVDRPLVFAALGTALPHLLRESQGRGSGRLPFPMPHPAETMRSITRAAALLEDCTVIVASVGLPVEAGELPPHVRLVEFLPQPLLLESVDLFLTHGGFNSVREALRTGTPMAVLPQFGDQFSNAERVGELGLGRRVDEATPEGIARVCRAVLADAEVSARARRARLAMLTLPEAERAVGDLERIAG
ncbi:glycosyltransferase [Streptomyces sp. NPDC127068]|uniref:glycosyltransferase n=1 Tax=Streptomyces sp. NPDC127068 TaxID=3347127 RepID=UPI00366126CF